MSKLSTILFLSCLVLNSAYISADTVSMGPVSIELPKQLKQDYHSTVLSGPGAAIDLQEFIITDPRIKPFWPPEVYNGPEDEDKWISWYVKHEFDRLSDFRGKSCISPITGLENVSDFFGRPAWLMTLFECKDSQSEDDILYSFLHLELILQQPGGYTKFLIYYSKDGTMKTAKDMGLALEETFPSKLDLPVTGKENAETYVQERKERLLAYVKNNILPNYKWSEPHGPSENLFFAQYGSVNTDEFEGEVYSYSSFAFNQRSSFSIRVQTNNDKLNNNHSSLCGKINEIAIHSKPAFSQLKWLYPIFTIVPRNVGGRSGLELMVFKRLSAPFNSVSTTYLLYWFEDLSPSSPWTMEISAYANMGERIAGPNPLNLEEGTYLPRKNNSPNRDSVEFYRLWNEFLNSIKPISTGL